MPYFPLIALLGTFCVSVTASFLRHFILALKRGACGIAEFAPISDGG